MSSVLFINRVYPPAEGATGQLLAELAAELVRRGHSVTVVTSRAGANVPRSEVAYENSSMGSRRGNEALADSELEMSLLTLAATIPSACAEVVAGVRVERVGGLPFTRASHLRRAVSYLSLYPAMLWRALRLPRHDVVVTLTDPPLLLLLGPLLKWGKGSKLVHWAQDLYPELAEEMEILHKGGLLARLLRGLSTWALRRCDRIVAVGQCMRTRLLQRGLAPPTIVVIPNWGHRDNADCRLSRVEPSASLIETRHAERCLANGERISESSDPKLETPNSKLFRTEHGLNEKFVVMYSGNLGLAHPFEAILDAAERLRSTLPRVLFLFVGSGPRLPWVQEQVQRRRLENVRFLPFQPKEKLSDSLGAADLHLASMRHELCGLVVPSKVYGVLAAGRPCVFLGPKESEAAQFILQHGCGSVLSNATGTRLAVCIGQWVRTPHLIEATRQRVRAVSGSVGLACAVDAFEEVLQGVNRSNTAETKTHPPCERPALGSPAGASEFRF